MAALNKESGDRIIIIRLWPSRSIDLNPRDFHLRGTVK
jgi:hypothetical protein